MVRMSWLVVALVALFEIIAFGLALGAVAKRSVATLTYSDPGYQVCNYTRDTSTGLAIAACIFLLIGQVLISVVTRCLCCGGIMKPGACNVILFVLSWITFVIAEIFLLAGASENRIETKGKFDNGATDAYCKQVRKAVFAIGAAFSFLTMFFSLLYYGLLARSQTTEPNWQSYNSGAPTVGMTAYN